MSVSLGPMPSTVGGLRARYGTLVKRVEDARMIGWRLMEEIFASELAATAEAMRRLGANPPKMLPPVFLGQAVPGEPIQRPGQRGHSAAKRGPYRPKDDAITGRALDALKALPPDAIKTVREVATDIEERRVEHVREALRTLCKHGFATRVRIPATSRNSARTAYRATEETA